MLHTGLNIVREICEISTGRRNATFTIAALQSLNEVTLTSSAGTARLSIRTRDAANVYLAVVSMPSLVIPHSFDLMSEITTLMDGALLKFSKVRLAFASAVIAR